MKPLLSAKDLSFWFDTSAPPVLDNINLSVYKGESLMLMGPSGCGKSTLAFLLAGLYPEYAGHIQGSVNYSGGLLCDLAPDLKSKRVSMLFQNPDDQFCMDTVEAEIFFTLENHNFQGDFSQKAAQLLDLVGLEGFQSRLVMELSGGEKQKLSLATALAIKPEVLILDEPLANLDPDSSAKLVKILSTLHSEGLTFLIVDHLLDPWLLMISRLAVLNEAGGLVKDDIKAGDLPKHKELFDSLGLISCGGISYPQAHGQTSEELTLKAQGLTVKRRGRTIFKDLDLELTKGSLTAILGANGSGKTTLFLTLAGLLRYKGQLDVKGKVGLVFQNPGFQFLTQSVLNEVLLSLAPKEGGRADSLLTQQALELLEDFKLSTKTKLSPWQLSQGEQRRLAVLTMICGGQNLLMLDEPTYSQDQQATLSIMELLMKKVKGGLTALIATHDVSLAKAFANKIYILKQGSLVSY